MHDAPPASGFALAATAIDPDALEAGLRHPAAGALTTFEGWRCATTLTVVSVRLLEYQVYPELAQAEGERVVAEALRTFDVIARALHASLLVYSG